VAGPQPIAPFGGIAVPKGRGRFDPISTSSSTAPSGLPVRPAQWRRAEFAGDFADLFDEGRSLGHERCRPR